MKRLKSGLCLVSGLFAVAATYFIYEVNRLETYVQTLKKSQVIYLAVFDAVAVLPNDFAVDTRSLTDSVSLTSERGRVVVGHGGSEALGEFYQKLTKSSQDRRVVCGLHLMKSTLDGVAYVVVWNSDTFLLFAGVDQPVVSTAVEYICKSR